MTISSIIKKLARLKETTGGGRLFSRSHALNRAWMASVAAAFLGPLAGNAWAQCATDSSGNGFDVTLQNGAVCAAGRTGSAGTAMSFDGVNDYATGPDGDLSLDVFSGGGTVSVWVYPTSYGGSALGRILHKGDPVNTAWTLYLNNSSVSGGLDFKRHFSTTAGIWRTPANSMTLNAWHHVVVVYDDSSTSNDPIIYIDGVSQTLTESTSPVGTPVSDTTFEFGIGNVPALTRSYQGKIEGVRFHRVMVNATDVSMMYGARGSWPMSEGAGSTIADESAFASAGTISGAAWTAGPLGSALSFDGVDDVVTIADNAASDNVFAGGGTVSAWFYATSFGEASAGRIVGKSTTGLGWALDLNNSGGNAQSVEFKRGFSGATGTWSTPVNSIKLNEWNHVAVTYNEGSAANVPTMYLNGKSVAVTTRTAPTGTATSDAAVSLKVGSNLATDRSFAGKIFGVQLHNVVMPADEIDIMYQAAPEAITPVVSYSFDETSGSTANDSATADGAQNGTLAGGVAFTAGALNNAASFDGVDDIVTFTGPTLGTSYAVSMWVYPVPSSESGAALISSYGSGITLMYTGGNQRLSFYYAGAHHYNNTALTENEWHHVALVSDNGNMTLYLDGVADGTATGAPSWQPKSIGDSTQANNNFKGKIDELKVFNRAISVNIVESLAGGFCSGGAD